jgi:hypothetical protein
MHHQLKEFDMKYVYSVAVLGALLSFSQFAAAEEKKPDYTDGNEFVSQCANIGADAGKMAWCKGFIIGFDQAHTTMSYVTRKGKEFDIEKDGLLYCPPNSVTHSQAIAMVVEYVKAHPTEANLPAGLLTAYALHDKYGCEKKAIAPSPKTDEQFKRE